MNAAANQWTAALATGAVLHSREVERGGSTPWPLAGGGLAAILTKLPDVLEPAVHPHHRQFFHSVACAVLVAAGWKALREWQPQSDDGRFWRKVGMIGAGRRPLSEVPSQQCGAPGKLGGNRRELRQDEYERPLRVGCCGQRQSAVSVE